MSPLLFVLFYVLGVGILVVSMQLTSSAMGGVEFGALHTVILKSLVLLIGVDLLSLLGTVGLFLSIPVWWLGLMFLFRIDFWECRTLVVINWILNLVLYLLIVGIPLTYNEPMQGFSK